MSKKLSIALCATAFVTVAVGAFANSLTIPHTFSAGTPSSAAEVNENFAAVQAAVDELELRLEALEESPDVVGCPEDTLALVGLCVEAEPRPNAAWFDAAAACAEADRRLPTASELVGIRDSESLSGFEWSADLDGLANRHMVSNSVVSASAHGGEQAFRCVLSRGL
jgi:hypothetical protein